MLKNMEKEIKFWSERIPLHALLIEISSLSTIIKLPETSAGYPRSKSNSPVIEPIKLLSDSTTQVSNFAGHGRQVKKYSTTKANDRLDIGIFEFLIKKTEQPDRVMLSIHKGSLQKGSGSAMILEIKYKDTNDIKPTNSNLWLETLVALVARSLKHKNSAKSGTEYPWV